MPKVPPFSLRTRKLPHMLILKSKPSSWKIENKYWGLYLDSKFSLCKPITETLSHTNSAVDYWKTMVLNLWIDLNPIENCFHIMGAKNATKSQLPILNCKKSLLRFRTMQLTTIAFRNWFLLCRIAARLSSQLAGYLKVLKSSFCV